MKVLLVGAGAVGIVYGYHLDKGGAEVSFLVKEQYAQAAREGFVLYPLNRGREVAPVIWKGAEILTSVEEVRERKWDQVWLCVSATALRAGWLDELVSAVGDATIVALQPGLEDRAYLLERVYDLQLVQGVISFISYQTPLSGESRPQPGIAYWFPPMAPSPFCGPRARVEAVVRTLKAGRCPAVVHPDATLGPAFLSAVLMPSLTLLEAEGWSFERFLDAGDLRECIAAMQEAIQIVAAFRGVSPPAWRLLLSPLMFRVLMRLARVVIPLDIETYLAYHFTKVGDQTRLLMDTYIRHGMRLELPVYALQRLKRRLEVAKAAAASAEAAEEPTKAASQAVEAKDDREASSEEVSR